MESSKFILDFSDESIVTESSNCKVFKFKHERRKRNKPVVEVAITEPEKPKLNLVKRSIVMEEVQFFIDLFGEDYY